jgi:hypothetical protein
MIRFAGTTSVDGVEDVLECLNVVVVERHEEVDAALGGGRRHEDEYALDGDVRREEGAGRAVAEVEVVEPEAEPAVHLEVRAERHARRRRRGLELLPGTLAEVDARHGVADDAHHGGVAGRQQLPRAHPRERPQHHVAEVLDGDGRAGPGAAVHGTARPRGP